MIHLMGILIYFKKFLVCLIDTKVIICLKWNLSAHIYQLILRDVIKMSKHISFCEIIYFCIFFTNLAKLIAFKLH